MSGNVIGKLYRGESNVDFVGRQKLWYSLSITLLILSLAGLFVRGLNFGVEFTGGSVFSFKAPTATVDEVRDSIESAGPHQVIVQKAGESWRATTESVPDAEITRVQQQVARDFDVPQDQVSVQVIGPSWGGQVSEKGIIGLIVFMVAIIVYLSIAFEWRMALAAVVALLHDLVITAGVYAWSGFEVTPATLLGFLTILGYSLYDAVVVFDMIKEVTAKLGGQAKITYTQAANGALNSTLIRSLNTSLVAILPVASILFIGTTLLGAGTLKDLALALFVGMIIGTYSSLCVATPLLVTLKEREPQYQALTKRVAARNQSIAKAEAREARSAANARAKSVKAGGKEPVAAAKGSATATQKRKKR